MKQEPQGEGLTLMQGSIRYFQGSKIQDEIAEFDYELKHLKDHLPAEELQGYWQLLDEIEQSGRIDRIVEEQP